MSLPICPHFQRGKCQYGSKCRLSHTQPLNKSPIFNRTPAINSPQRACAFYAQGLCTKGEKCPFRHSPPIIKSGDSPKVTTGAFAPCAFFLKGRCAKGQECPFPHPDGGNPPCRFFFSGSCRFGSQCSSSHTATKQNVLPTPAFLVPVRAARPVVIRSADGQAAPAIQAPVTLQPITEGMDSSANGPSYTPLPMSQEAPPSDTHERNLCHCKASFGSGGEITEIVTSFESRTLIISNVLDEDTQETLLTAFEPFGRLESIALLKDTDTAQARVTYASVAEASAAVRGLSASPYMPKMDLKVVESGQAVLRSTKVKISWFAPKRIGWAHYPTITMAREQAKCLKGSSFEGFIIDATFQIPSIHQYKSFSVELKGLPTHTYVPNLQKFCQSRSVQLKEIGYDRRSSLLDVEAQLRAIGSLDSFDPLPEDKKRAKILAFAQFSLPEDAAKAVTALHQKPQSYLNRSPMWLELIHAVRYNIPQPLFVAVKIALDRLSDDVNDCKLRIYEPNEEGATDVCIRLFSSNPQSLGMAKRKLEVILDGEKVFDDDGNVLWDDFFLCGEGKALLGGLHHVYAKCDTRNRTIHLYGSGERVAEARICLLNKLESLKTKDSIIRLDRRMLVLLMKGGLDRLRAQFGEGAIIINIVHRTLEVTNDDVESVKIALSRLQVGTKVENVVDGQSCPVCYCEVDNPIILACGHAYCKECLTRMLLATSSSSPTARCIHEDGDKGTCKAGIDIGVIRSLLRPEQEQDLFRTSFLSHVHSRPEEFKYCPTPDCNVLYRPASAGTVLACPSCLNRICAACHIQFHEGLTCIQHREESIEGGNKKFEEWKAANNVKGCPKCGANIQKIAGCNHMTCARCQTHMCWICLKTFNAGKLDSEGGVYGHIRKVHGDIY